MRALGRRGTTLTELLVFLLVSFVVLEALIRLTNLTLRDQARETRAASPAISATLASHALTSTLERATALTSPAAGQASDRLEGMIGLHENPGGLIPLVAPDGVSEYERFLFCVDGDAKLWSYLTTQKVGTDPQPIKCGAPGGQALLAGNALVKGGKPFSRPAGRFNAVSTRFDVVSPQAGEDGLFHVDLLSTINAPSGAQAAP